MAPMDVETNRGRDQEEILVGSEREATTGDFWRMCWQTKCKFVVMLWDMTSGLSGCAKYFPLKPGTSEAHGDLTVTHLISRKTSEDYIERELSLRKDGEELRVHHFHYTSWPNFGLPVECTITDFVAYVQKRVQEFETTATGSMDQEPRLIVHCYAGIGRSGTFLTIYHAYCRLLERCDEIGNDMNYSGNPSNDTTDDDVFNDEGLCLYELVRQLRMQRHPWMVEGVEQYRTAYHVVRQLITQLKQQLADV